MARYNDNENREAVYELIQQWKQRCLIDGQSMFTDARLWTAENFKSLVKHFVDQPDEPANDFYTKFEKQLAATSDEVKQLAAELFWLLQIGVSSVGPASKRKGIEKIWGWSNTPLPESSALDDSVMAGLGSGGAGYSLRRADELTFAVSLFERLLGMPSDKRQDLLADGWKFAEWLLAVPEPNMQFRHIILYLMYPDAFERVFTKGHRKDILIKLGGIEMKAFNKLTSVEIDRKLLSIRKGLESEYKTEDVDYYMRPFSERWGYHTDGIAEPSASSARVSRSSARVPRASTGHSSTQGLNQIFYGPPGTGKTYHAVDRAVQILDPKLYAKAAAADDRRQQYRQRFDQLRKEGRIEFVTFHQSFSYEDFVEGLKAESVDGSISYQVESGVFKTICDSCERHDACVLIIDEINRGNIASIFGELITLIEESKRKGTEEALSTTLPYSKKPFSVPANLHIIGTMNTADRSLVRLDTALRRRFQFEEMMPDLGLLDGIEVDGINIRDMLATINDRIELLYDREHTLGHTFFLPLRNEATIERLAQIFELRILPLLEEYFFEDWSRIRQVLGDDQKNGQHEFFKNRFTNDRLDRLLKETDNSTSRVHFRRNEAALRNSAAYRGIYQDVTGQPADPQTD